MYGFNLVPKTTAIKSNLENSISAYTLS